MTHGGPSVVSVVVVAALLLCSDDALACSCMPIGPPCQATWQADAVFAGSVRAIEEIPDAEYPALLVRFHVEQGFVNATPGPLDVRTPAFGASCGYGFEVGHRYLVYANGGSGSQLVAGVCSRTRRIEEAAEDLRYLTHLPPTAAGGRVFGRLTQRERHPAEPQYVDHGPLEGIVVNVRSVPLFVDTTTDRHGRYEVTGLPIGPLVVTVFAPTGFNQEGLVRELEIKNPRSCSQQDFELRSSARASGLVVDPSGRPVPGVEIDAVAAELAAHQPPPHQMRARTGADGRFRFDDLPPGTYVFGINLTKAQWESPRGRPVFVPGTSDLHEATVTDLAPGDRTDVGVLQLPIP